MSGLLSVLRQGAQSLLAQQAYSSTVAQNLSNANTAGYARQRAELAAVTPADQYGSSYIGRGAVLQAITQSRDRFVEQQVPLALGSEARSSTQASLLQGVSALNPDAGLSDSLSNFYAQLRALAQNPGSPNVREAVVGAATRLAVSFNQTAIALDSARSGVDARIQAQLPEVNEAMAQIARLNSQISQASINGARPNDLLDARTKLVDRVASLTGARIVNNEAGDANLVLPGGTSLVQGDKAATLSAQPDPSNNGNLALWIRSPSAVAPTRLAEVPGGALGGMLDARDGAMRAAQERVDTFAFDFATAVNAVAQTGFALDGSTGRSVFAVQATVTGAARSLAIDASLASDASLFPAAGVAGAPGDATVVQQMIDTETQPLSSGRSAEEELASITASYGATTSRVTATAEGDGAVLKNLETLRQSASGVSVDEELVNMQRSQRAYEAVARVIKTADQMLETLLGLR
ncbi:MAG: flagellar hook-associated protein FlgK [Myxococcaceae bacterium]|nr:flagellar hook-associated protein FlgK [Myxococcaceae bacterium]